MFSVVKITVVIIIVKITVVIKMVMVVVNNIDHNVNNSNTKNGINSDDHIEKSTLGSLVIY